MTVELSEACGQSRTVCVSSSCLGPALANRDVVLQPWRPSVEDTSAASHGGKTEAEFGVQESISFA